MNTITFLPLLILIINLAFGGQLPEGFEETQLVQNLDPTAMAMAPDGRVFIVEKNGRILIVENDALLPVPFLTLEVDNFNERGLCGFAFDPNFENNHYVYVYYTVKEANHNRVSRFVANGNLADASSETVLLDLDSLSGSVHNGGAMVFDAEGKLYIAVGDGAASPNAQSLESLLGKILRINPDGSIPDDNPFYNTASGKNRAIWAMGLRNPFSIAIQPGTGRFFANDVGKGSFEEVNDIQKGKNYGWPLIEGFRKTQSPPEDYQDPLFAYNHDEGCSIIGAAFYDPAQPVFPEAYHGKFFFADYCAGYIKVLDPASGELESTFATEINRPVSIQISQDGALYYLERAGRGGGSPQDNTSSKEGSLWKAIYTGSKVPTIGRQPDSLLVPDGKDAVFSLSASGSEPLSYQWQVNGEDIPEATEADYTLVSVSLEDDGKKFTCIVSNDAGFVVSDTALLSVTANKGPEVTILQPEEDRLYQAGDTLFFKGTATDPEDGLLPAEALTWSIDFHHDKHTHPALAPLSGVDSGYYVVPRVGETDDNVWYRIYLTASDSNASTETVYREIYPQKQQITLQTEPAGLQLNLDGTLVETPYTFTSVVGITRTLAAPLSQQKDEVLYAYDQWLDIDQENAFSINAPERDSTFIAHYVEVAKGEGTGLFGAYYNDDQNFEGVPSMSRIDAQINFDWHTDSPEPERVNSDSFSIRWTGFVLPQFSEEYTFYINSDDGIRLWIDTILVVDKWIPQPAAELSGTIHLNAGVQYPIRLEYFEEVGEASVALYWSSTHTLKQIIPESQLFPDPITGLDNLHPKALTTNLFPNPVEKMLHVKLWASQKEEIQWSVMDMLGKTCMQGNTIIVPGKDILAIDMSSIPSGVYTLLARRGNFTYQPHKFVKQ